MFAAAVRTAAAVVILIAGAPAHAHHTIPQVRAEVRHLISAEDQAVQEYDQAAQDLRSARQRLRVLGREVRDARASVDSQQSQVAQIAAAAYESGTIGPASTALTANPEAVVNQAAVLSQLSDSQKGELRQYAAALHQLQAMRTVAFRAEAGTALLARQAVTRKRSVTSALHKQQALLSSLTARQLGAAQASMPGGAPGVSGAYTGPTNTQAGKAVAYAYSKLGDPYVWGATGPNTFDCSGLVQAAWASAGVSIPRTTFEQIAALPAVPVNALQPGDLLFFLSGDHVGIYVGGGYLIDAPQTGQNVEKVPFAGWFRANFDSAARP